MRSLQIFNCARGILLVDTKAKIPAYANFFASDKGEVHKNMWRNPGALKDEFHWYYLIIAASFPLDGLPIIEVPLKTQGITGYEIEWWLKDSTRKSEIRLNLKKSDTIDGVMPRPELNALYGDRLYRKLILKYDV